MKLLKKIGMLLFTAVIVIGIAACGPTAGEEKPVVRDPSDTDDFRMNELTTLNVGLSWNAS